MTLKRQNNIRNGIFVHKNIKNVVLHMILVQIGAEVDH
jgi:hypothetical protein